jgi:hypothetical protein
MAGLTYSWPTPDVADAAADKPVTTTWGLQVVQALIHLREWAYGIDGTPVTFKTPAVGHCHDDSDSSVIGTDGVPEAAIQADAVGSKNIKDADGTSGQDTSTGYGIKTNHMQDLAVTEAKLSIGSMPQTKLNASAGDIENVNASADGEQTSTSDTYEKKKEIACPRSGTLRISFDLKSSNLQSVYGRIYRNGVAVGTEQSTAITSYTTYSQDISGWSHNDLIQLYVRRSGAAVCYCRNFRVKTQYYHDFKTILN